MHSLMLKEIYQQKEALLRLKQFYFIENKPVLPSNMRYDFDEIKFVASGSSYNAGLVGRYLFSKYTERTKKSWQRKMLFLIKKNN